MNLQIDLTALNAFIPKSRVYNTVGYEIYVLLDPTTKVVRYVGFSNDAKSRLSSHRSVAQHNPCHPVHVWLSSLNRDPILEVIAGAPDWSEAHRVERYWIRYFSRLGAPLLNVVRTAPTRGARSSVSEPKSSALA
jgi:hypothetical protein